LEKAIISDTLSLPTQSPNLTA